MVKNPLPENGRITHKYDDIIHMEYPFADSDADRHSRMPLQDRAKIFAPFAALKGYNEAILAKQKIVVPKMELSEESKEYLDLQLGKVKRLLEEKHHPVITVVYFQKDGRDGVEGGEYLSFTGAAAKFEPSSRMLQVAWKKIRLDDICSIEGEDLEQDAGITYS